MIESTASSGSDLPSPPGSGSEYRFAYHGEGSSFFLLLLKNVLLTVLTLGIYAAWAKANRRQYIWSHFSLHGQRFSFTGTGMEMFLGYLKVALVYLLLFGPPGLVRAMGDPGLAGVLSFFGGVVLFLLIPYAIYRSRAYVLSRTRWRGIRLGMAGNAGPYVKAFLVTAFYTVITLGLYSPFRSCRLRAILTNDTRFGSQALVYDGRGKELFPIWIKGVLLTVLTLGVYSFWLRAATARYHFAHTRLSGARFRMNVTGGHLLKIALAQIFGVILTLGIAFPWIATWTLRRLAELTALEGEIDFQSIVQRWNEAEAEGDALADALDVGLGI